MAGSSTEHLSPHIVLLGTCDTKMEDVAFVHAQLSSLCPEGRLVLVDVGRSSTQNNLVTVTQAEILKSAGGSDSAKTDLSSCSRDEYLGKAIEATTSYVRNLHQKDPLHGVIGLGGSTGSSIIAPIMRNAIPIGLPKLLVSTVASGDVSHLVGGVDMTLMYSVVDIAGLNFLSKRVLGNAAAAICGMATLYARETASLESTSEGKTRKRRIAITMFGVTTPGVDQIRKILTEPPHNAEVVVFHATGSGGRAMETLIRQKSFDAIIDLTTTEIADEINGDGNMSAGPDRLSAGAEAGIPMIVSVGACDMINFGPKDTIKTELLEAAERGERNLYVHNELVTIMRTTKEENRRIAEFMVNKLKQCKRKDLVRVLLPTKAVSMISGKGGPFEDSEADNELFLGLENGLDGQGIEVCRYSLEVNDREFAEAVVDKLLEVQESATELFSSSSH
jgi:uncharacterized protein (UPF0261 family)